MSVITEATPVEAPPLRRFGVADLREILMGAQDNLTNVTAVVLGVAIGSGQASTVALAGLAAGIAEAISMGGVLYTSTRAESALRPTDRKPLRAAAVCFAAALVAALIPLAPFWLLPIRQAVLVSMVVSGTAIFGLGAWTGWATRRPWWQEGIRLLLIAGLAAAAAALIGLAFGASI